MKRNMSSLSKSLLSCLLGIALAAATALSVSADVIRVDFQPNAPFAGRAPADFTGVETQAAAANSIFGSNGSNTWNYLSINPSTPTTDPAFSNLVDSAGTTTGVSVAFTGILSSANDGSVNNSGSNALENDYFLIDGYVPSALYTIGGLPANTTVALCLYAPNFTLYDSPNPVDQPNRGYNLTANGELITVPSGPDDNALAYITTDALGDISGTWSTAGNEGDWSGFQIAWSTTQIATPEPATWEFILCGLGLLVIRYSRHRRAAK